MSLNRNLRNAALIAGCVVLLASCGGSETERSAASAPPAMATPSSGGSDVTAESSEAPLADPEVSTQVEAGAGEPWPRRAVCPERKSWTMKVKVQNATPLALTLGAGSIDCSDWSGVSTPPTAMTGQVVSSDSTSSFTLEPSDNSDRNWTIGVMVGSKEIGTFRARIRRGSNAVELGDVQNSRLWCTTERVGEYPSGIEPLELPRKIDQQTFLLSSVGSSIFVTVCGSEAQITDSVTVGGPTSGAEQPQTGGEGAAKASVKDTTICIENLSSVTPTVSFSKYKMQSGQGSLRNGSKACATGWSFFGNDVEGRIALPAPNAQMWLYATNPVVGSAIAELRQTNAGFCLYGSDVGERKTWDDGLLMYVMERKPDGVNKEFQLTIRDSAKPSADGKARVCTGSTGGGGLI